jgi:hypothetical protein
LAASSLFVCRRAVAAIVRQKRLRTEAIWLNIHFQPEYIMEILFDLFIRRNNKEMGEEKFARLITEIKDVKWQGDILRKLVHLYPEEPHFPAHLVRYYLYMAKNLDEANNAADKAIETSERQGKVVSLLYHIKGLCI